MDWAADDVQADVPAPGSGERRGAAGPPASPATDLAGVAAGLAAELAAVEPLSRTDLDGTLQRAERVLEVARAHGLTNLTMRARVVVADVLERRGQVPEAGRLCQQVLTWAGEHGDRWVQARSSYVLAAVFSDLGDTALALEHAVRAVDLLDATAPAVVRVDHLVRLADSVALSGSVEAARERYDEVRRLTEDLGDLDRQLLVINNRSCLEEAAGEAEAAQAWSARMQALAAEHGVRLHLGRLDTVARALIGLGRLEEAEQVMLPALDPAVLHDVPDGSGAADSLLTLAEVRRRLGRPDAAQAALDGCLRLCAEHGYTDVQVRAGEEQAALHAARGRFAEAYEAHRAFHAAAVSLQSAQREARARAVQAMYEATEARQQSRRYRELSLRDPLTGLYNRRYVDEQLPSLLRRTAEQGAQLTLALVDLDHFKVVNDTCSHDTGDTVLQVVAGLLQQAGQRAPTGGFAARFGGEEFLLVLPGRDGATAAAELEQLRRAVRDHDWSSLVGGTAVTVSIGAATEPAAGARTADLLASADRRLYLAKHAGRDRVAASET